MCGFFFFFLLLLSLVYCPCFYSDLSLIRLLISMIALNKVEDSLKKGICLSCCWKHCTGKNIFLILNKSENPKEKENT